jgi:hypothetical protein
MKRLTSRVLFKASPMMLAVALGLLGPAALNDEEDDGIADEASPVPATPAAPHATMDTLESSDSA